MMEQEWLADEIIFMAEGGGSPLDFFWRNPELLKL